jgi:hypothetical protein
MQRKRREVHAKLSLHFLCEPLPLCAAASKKTLLKLSLGVFAPLRENLLFHGRESDPSANSANWQ